MLQGEFRNQVYNAAHSAGDAELMLAQTGRFANFLEKAADVFSKHNVADFAGVFLIHRHNHVADGQAMIETDAILDGADALVTRPRDAKETAVSVPTRWIVGDGCFEPFEYSDNLRMRPQLSRLDNTPEFLRDVRALLNRFELTDLVGLCLFDRGLYEKGPAGHILVETTDEETSSNIVRWMSGDLDQSKLIKTVWHFAPSKGEGGGCVPQCNEVCYFSSPDDQHKSFHKSKHFNIA